SAALRGLAHKELHPDRDEGVGDGSILLLRDRQDLRLVLGVLRDDHEGRWTITLDVELDPANPLERDIEGQAIMLDDDQAPIADGKRDVSGARSGLKGLVRGEPSSNVVVAVVSFRA